MLVWKAEMSNPWEERLRSPSSARVLAPGRPRGEIPTLAGVCLIQVKAPWRFLWRKM